MVLHRLNESIIPKIKDLFDKNGVEYKEDNGDLIISRKLLNIPGYIKEYSNLMKAHEVLHDEFGPEDGCYSGGPGPNPYKSEWTKFNDYHFQIDLRGPARLSELPIVASPKPLSPHLDDCFWEVINIIEDQSDDTSVYKSDIIEALALVTESHSELSKEEISQLRDALYREYNIH